MSPWVKPIIRRTDDELAAENAALRQEIARLQVYLPLARAFAAERLSVDGDLSWSLSDYAWDTAYEKWCEMTPEQREWLMQDDK